MTRHAVIIICVIATVKTSAVNAQHHHSNSRSQSHPESTRPYFSYSTFGPGGMGGFGHGHFPGHFHGYRIGVPMVWGGYVSQPAQLVSYTYPVSTTPYLMPFPLEPNKPKPVTSTPAAKLKSLDLQTRGDQKMKEQKWGEARAAYSSSISSAPDRAAPHLKLAVCFVTIQRYDSAIREIRRALSLDSKVAGTGGMLETVFGPDSVIIRNSIISRLGDWVREDMNDPDRLFLYGVILHLNSDARAHEMLEAALRHKTNGDVEHIVLLLKDSQKNLGINGFLNLNGRPAPLVAADSKHDLRFPKTPAPMPDAPVPMPDGPIPMR